MISRKPLSACTWMCEGGGEPGKARADRRAHRDVNRSDLLLLVLGNEARMVLEEELHHVF